MSYSFKSHANTYPGSSDYGRDLADHFGAFDAEFHDRRVADPAAELQVTPRDEARGNSRARQVSARA
ncbi:hypothetical protein [Paraburkholderia sp. JPY419]|uniref:hypothetical protein n=1 Tax=Paraburkholderia sp. JPY419 TaxID=667660 RepID=UPI003D1CE2A1